MSDDNAIIVDDGALITIDPADSLVLKFDWGTRHLNTGVNISSSTFTITPLSPSTADGLTKDSANTLSAAPYYSRWSVVRIIAGGATKLGQLFELACTIVTDESPTQTKQRSCRVLIQDK